MWDGTVEKVLEYQSRKGICTFELSFKTTESRNDAFDCLIKLGEMPKKDEDVDGTPLLKWTQHH